MVGSLKGNGETEEREGADIDLILSQKIMG
jgi:hypothetical protein